MRIANYRHLIFACLMMSFIGQVVASAALPCQSPSVFDGPREMTHSQHMDLTGASTMDHSQHSNSDNTTPEQMSSDCCQDCECNMGCTSAALHCPHMNPASAADSPNHQYQEPSISPLAVPFFRPPIFR